MFKLFQMGGPLFMGILTLLFFTAIVLAIRCLMKLKNNDWDNANGRRQLSYIKSVGTLAFVIGVLGQLIGLYSAFTTIEATGEIAPGILAGGLKVSMITTIYGVIIFVVSYLIWMFMDTKLNSK